MPWPAFETFFAERWQPGQHVALVGPTGMGKTTMAGAILPLRKYVLALDPKGGDSTLGALEKRGFERIDHWVDRFEKHGPPRSVREKIGNGEPARLIVSHAHRTADDFVKLKALLLQVLNAAFEQGGWTFYMDELQVACDMMGLKKDMERLLIASRDRGVSVVSSFQSPRWVPRAASDQASHLFTYYNRDDDVQKRLAEMMGRPKPEIRGAMKALGSVPHSVLYVSRNPLEPMLVTRPPKL